MWSKLRCNNSVPANKHTPILEVYLACKQARKQRGRGLGLAKSLVLPAGRSGWGGEAGRGASKNGSKVKAMSADVLNIHGLYDLWRVEASTGARKTSRGEPRSQLDHVVPEPSPAASGKCAMFVLFSVCTESVLSPDRTYAKDTLHVFNAYDDRRKELTGHAKKAAAPQDPVSEPSIMVQSCLELSPLLALWPPAPATNRLRLDFMKVNWACGVAGVGAQ